MPSPTGKRIGRTPQEIWQELQKVKGDNPYLDGAVTLERIEEQFRNANKDGVLYGYLFALKDLISNTDSRVTGGSKFLKDYYPPFNSSVYRALVEAGAVNIAQSNLDEFGLGGSGISSAYGIVPNPRDKTRIIGGSSSGSVYLISSGLADFSLASDTGDSARYPASLVGIIGFKPSYGMISRYGFYPFCSSLDTPSICADSMETVAKVFTITSFKDPNDLCTSKVESRNYLEEMSKPLNRRVKIAVIKDLFWSRDPILTDSHREIKDKFWAFLEDLGKEMDVDVEWIDFEDNRLLRLCTLIYAVVAYSEGVSNYSNMTGLLFPFRADENGAEPLMNRSGDNYDEILRANRKSLGREFVFRQMMGRYFVDGDNYEELYLKCKRLMGTINGIVSRIFQKYDVIISPTTMDIPPKIEDWTIRYYPANDLNLRLVANFCAIPAISIPWEEVKGMPIGMHLMSDYQTDAFLLRFSNRVLEWIRGRCR